MVNNVIDNNIDYIVALGTTAETPTHRLQNVNKY